MKRGEVCGARLDPVEGSDRGGTRPVVVVSRDSIRNNSAVALAEQARVLSQPRLVRLRGALEPGSLAQVSRAPRIAFDLD